MDNTFFKSNWNQLKGVVKEKWGQLTDDDLMQIEGNYDKFKGLLQEKYGYSKSELENQMQEFEKSCKNKRKAA